MNRLAYAHQKQFRRLLRAEEHADTPEKTKLHKQAVRTFLEVGKHVHSLADEVKATEAKIQIARTAMNKFLRKI